MLRNRQAGRLTLAVLCAAVLSESESARTSAFTCGAYTDRLCESQSLMASEYLESPNGDYKFYYQNNGVAVLYYVRTDPWTTVEVLHSGAFGTPQELTYTDPWVNWTYGSTFGDVHITVWSTWDDEDWLDGLYYDTGVEPTGDHFLVLDNSGYLKTVDDTGTIKVWAGPS